MFSRRRYVDRYNLVEALSRPDGINPLLHLFHVSAERVLPRIAFLEGEVSWRHIAYDDPDGRLGASLRRRDQLNVKHSEDPGDRKAEVAIGDPLTPREGFDESPRACGERLYLGALDPAG